jgi:hypothetical protein
LATSGAKKDRLKIKIMSDAFQLSIGKSGDAAKCQPGHVEN